MQIYRRIIISILIAAFFFCQFPQLSLAAEVSTKQPPPLKITENRPHTHTTEEIDIPPGGGLSKTTKIILGVIGVAALAGLALGLSGGDGGDTPQTGNIPVAW